MNLRLRHRRPGFFYFDTEKKPNRNNQVMIEEPKQENKTNREEYTMVTVQ